MVRTQLYLDEAIHARLTEIARKQRRTLSDLVRDALTRAYGAGGPEARLRTLRAIRGTMARPHGHPRRSRVREAAAVRYAPEPKSDKLV